MNGKLHHINLCSEYTRAMDALYRDVLMLGDDDPLELPSINEKKGL